MKYVSYKESDGTIVPSLKIALYDIVIINARYWINELGIVMHINEDAKRIKVRVIKCGMDLLLSPKNVTFVNHNNKTAAKSYIDLCDKLSHRFKLKYTDIYYIRDNWGKDIFMLNDITAVTIVEAADIYVGHRDSANYTIKCMLWMTNHEKLISMIIHYGNVDFVIESLKHSQNIVDYDLTVIKKLHKLFYL